MSQRFSCVTPGMKRISLVLAQAVRIYRMCFESGVWGSGWVVSVWNLQLQAGLR